MNESKFPGIIAALGVTEARTLTDEESAEISERHRERNATRRRKEDLSNSLRKAARRIGYKVKQGRTGRWMLIDPTTNDVIEVDDRYSTPAEELLDYCKQRQQQRRPKVSKTVYDRIRYAAARIGFVATKKRNSKFLINNPTTGETTMFNSPDDALHFCWQIAERNAAPLMPTWWFHQYPIGH